MADKTKDKAPSREGAPRLRAETRRANTIDEVVVGGGSGQAELDWVLDPANFAKAKRMLRGGGPQLLLKDLFSTTFYFFPNVILGEGEDERVACVSEGEDRFLGHSSRRDRWWRMGDRAVVTD